MGAYFVGAALAAGAFSIRFVPAAYDIQTMHLMSQGVFTNTSPSGPYRGAGRPEAAYFMERLIEHAARKSPASTARRSAARNLIPPAKLPYTTPTHWVYDSGEFVRLMDRAWRTATGRATPRASANSKKNGKLRGRSVCFYIEFGGVFNERMEMRFDPSGTVTIFGGTHSHGQGHATTFAQLAHEMARRAVREDPLRAGRHRRRSRSAAAPMARAARWSAAPR